ncbi:MAG TPA: DUF4115 domain-containing protein [Gammaproteobacteria bacterium]|nr:DUF4115 domain-containing protein [Gammaproteobacteria bacterium]
MGARDDDTQQQTAQAGLAAVGARLAKARKEQQLELAAVATQLHLRVEMVRAIESGDEAQLPAVTFIRGYIRSYARLLDIDDSELMAQLPVSDEHRPAPLRRVGMRRPGVSLHIGKWLLWGLVLALLVLFVSYGVPMLERLWSGRGAEPAVDQLELPHTGAGAEDNALALPVLPQEDTEQPQQDTPVSEPETETSSEPVAEPEAEPAPAPESETPAQEAPPAAGPAVILLRFKEDSWVEMEAQGRKLVAGIQRAGSERTVRADPPIRILLGNAPGVELIYRGEVVDIKPYQRGKVARLTLED